MWWLISLAVVAALLGTSPGAWAEAENRDAPAKRALPHQTDCPVKLPADFWDAEGAEEFRASEEWAWKQICVGEWADMRHAPGGEGSSETCKPAEIEEAGDTVPDHRRLRPDFLELILSHQKWVLALRSPLVGIKCALIDANVYLASYQIQPSLIFHDGKIDGEIDLLGTNFSRTLSLIGSTVTGLLNADRMEVGGGLFLHGGGTFADIDLLGAKIGGDVSLTGSTVTGLLNADAMQVGGYLYLRGGGKFADIDLLGAKIVGNAEFDGSTVTGLLNAGRMDLGGYLFLRSGGTFADIDLLSTKIGGDVQLAGSTFTGEVDATGSRIQGELHVSSDRLGVPTWKDGARLLLRNASADAIQGQMTGWDIPGNEKGTVPTDLTGFTYNRFGGLLVSSGKGMGEETAKKLIQWIEAQHDHGTHYDPQPYEQLAKVLRDAGAEEKAKAIRYAKFEHKSRHDNQMGEWESAWLEAQRLLVGYGVYPFRVLYWFGGIVGIGALLAFFSADRNVRRFPYPLWYSLENALPLIDLNQSFQAADHGNRWLSSFFHFQKIAGFLFATILVGALSLLGG